ncbi:MAG TPA: beta-propeller fold lactonase family protein [Verrucomicrobiae bacterium]
MKKSLFANCFTCLTLGLGLFTGSAKAEDGGALYTMDNAAAGNHVLVFERGERGSLLATDSVATGGLGTGAAQGFPSQGSVLLSRDGRWVFVCNAGSGEISVLAVSRGGLTLTDKVASGGRMPVSLALRHNLLYAPNAGGLAGDKDNITAFIFANGRVVPLPDSTRGLSADNTGPAQVSFSREGDALIVTERLTSLIDTFVVGQDGLVTDAKAFQSVGATPFGFDVGRENRLFVSEAPGSAASSYQISEDGDLAVISGSVPTHQAAACWLLTARNGRFIYTANAGSGSISGFRVGNDGSLHLLDPSGVTGSTGSDSHPTDMVQSRDGRFLYSLNNGNGTISAFAVPPNGSLDPLMTVSGLPTSAAGLAGR